MALHWLFHEALRDDIEADEALALANNASTTTTTTTTSTTTTTTTTIALTNERFIAAARTTPLDSHFGNDDDGNEKHTHTYTNLTIALLIGCAAGAAPAAGLSRYERLLDRVVARMVETLDARDLVQ